MINIKKLKEDKYRNSFLISLGLSYWMTAILEPDLIGNFSPTLSMISMIIMGILILGNLIINSKILWILLGIRATYGMIASWLMITQWAVPYAGNGSAAVSMAILNGIAAATYISKSLE